MTADASTSSSNKKLAVYVRVRPMNAAEKKAGHRTCLNIEEETFINVDGIRHNFNRVFDEGHSNEEIYKGAVEQIVHTLFDGSNCSVFAYGATGAGKTYTMHGTKEDPGLFDRALKDILKLQKGLPPTSRSSIEMSYIEVYNERVRDLLKLNSPLLQVQEDGKGRIRIKGLTQVTIRSPNQLYSLVESGNTRRAKQTTIHNIQSSRSHAILQLHLKIVKDKKIQLSTMSMIDLAGSEKGGEGIDLKESLNINRSLLTFGRCVNTLRMNKKHIPYRDSKLTRVLKDAIGGKCLTIIIANISPSEEFKENTLNTLKFGLCASTVECQVPVPGEREDKDPEKMGEEFLKKLQAMAERIKREDFAGNEFKNLRALIAEQQTIVNEMFKME